MKVKLPSGKEFVHKYDKCDRLVSVTMPNGNTHHKQLVNEEDGYSDVYTAATGVNRTVTGTVAPATKNYTMYAFKIWRIYSDRNISHEEHGVCL